MSLDSLKAVGASQLTCDHVNRLGLNITDLIALYQKFKAYAQQVEQIISVVLSVTPPGTPVASILGALEALLTALFPVAG